jgi:tetratricopeptide (TPR) repeat protein
MEQIREKFPGSYDLQYNLTLAYFQSKQFEKASQAAGTLARQYPRAEAYNLFAMIEEEGKHYLKAVEAFQKAAELEPGNEGYRFDYGFELLAHQTNPAAIAIFSSGVRDFPNSLRMRLGLGSAYYFGGKPEEASITLLEAIRIDAQNKFLYFFLGKLYDSVPASQTAIEKALRSYLKTDPIDPWAYYHCCIILYSKASSTSSAQFQLAKNYLNQALTIDPHFAEGHLQFGIFLQEAGYPAESIPRLQKALRFNPKLAMAHFRLGQAYRKLGDKEKALAEFDLFEKLNAQGHADQSRQKVMQFLVELKK